MKQHLKSGPMDAGPALPRLDDGAGSLAAAMDALGAVLMGSDDRPPPPGLAARPDFMAVYEYLRALRAALSEFAAGRMDAPLEAEGVANGYLKTIQANLKHLAWQLSKVSEGDFTQRVDYLGDFSEAFNRMVEQLSEQQRAMETRRVQVTELAQRLQNEIRQRDTVEAALRASENTYRQMALRDSLTGIYNRGYFTEIATREIENLKRNGGEACFLMADVDHFKLFNDTHGHLCGDAALKMIARTMSDLMRKADLLARYGGEEFVLMLGGTGLNTGIIIAERIRAAVASQPSPAGDGQPITISIGLAVIGGAQIRQSGPADNILNNVIQQADTALYLAKEKGRNKVWWAHHQGLT